jgi:hypothetical protein
VNITICNRYYAVQIFGNGKGSSCLSSRRYDHSTSRAPLEADEASVAIGLHFNIYIFSILLSLLPSRCCSQEHSVISLLVTDLQSTVCFQWIWPKTVIVSRICGRNAGRRNGGNKCYSETKGNQSWGILPVGQKRLTLPQSLRWSMKWHMIMCGTRCTPLFL